jgi:hypothetical protein
MTAAYFEDHPTDPEKVILRKPSHSTDCQNCEYHRKRAQRWREEAYKQSGYPLPERGWVGLSQENFLEACEIAERGNYLVAFQRIQQILKERNE